MLERDKVTLEKNWLRAALEQMWRLHERTANCDQLKSELERLQRKQQEFGSRKERKTKTQIEPLMARSRPESKMEVDWAHRASGRFNHGRIAQDLDTWTPRNPFLLGFMGIGK